MNGKKTMLTEVTELKETFLESLKFQSKKPIAQLPDTLELTRLSKGQYPHI